jgi:small-conductance mechanosensitive channel
MGEPQKAIRQKKVEKLSKKEEVKKALQQATPGEAEREPQARPAARKRRRVSFAIYGTVLAVLGVLYYLVQNEVISLPGFRSGVLPKLPLAAIVVVGVLFVERVVEVYGIRRASSSVSRYNLTRIVRLAAGVLLVGAAGFILFGNFYTGLVSLGVISIILGLAVQTPMTSFIGWIYILVRAPYRVGDRVKIDDATGDVIEVGYLDTTLWEFGGQYLSTDHPSGRIIKFPNSKVLNSIVYNYSWPLFPYIWNEIKFHVAYESDLEFVAQTMKEVVREHRGENMASRVRVYRDLLSRTPVDELSVKEHPEVVFRVSDNTWLEAIVRYLVDPKHAGSVKTELIQKTLERLKAAPDRVLFPKSNAR